MDYVVSVELPRDRPLFGLKDELHISIGLSIDLRELQNNKLEFSCDENADWERIVKGLVAFKSKYMSAKISALSPDGSINAFDLLKLRERSI